MLEKTIYINKLDFNMKYEITSTKKQFDDYGLVQIYGINAYREGFKYASEDYLSCCIEDISSDYSFVQFIVQKLSEHKVLPVHIKDIICDFV